MLTPLLLAVVTAVQPQTAPAPRDAGSTARRTCAISGRISEQGSGRPVPRALVTLQTIGTPRRVEVIADAQGHYELEDLEPGEYVLWAAPGDLVSTHLAQSFNSTAPLDLFAQRQPNISLKAGELLTEIDIALARALAIEGRLSDSFDEPMANIEVGVVRADGRPVSSRSVYSDDRGQFRIFALAPGRYRVCARPESGSTTSDDTLRFVRTCHLASISESNAADVLLDAEDATGIDIRLQRSGTYAVSGSVVDAAGAPSDGAMISVVRDDHSVSANATSRGGQFTLSGLTPGSYLVSAFIGGPRDPSDTRPPAREREFGYVSVDIEGADASGIVVSMSQPVKVAGRVRFEGRAPAPSHLHMVVQTHPSLPMLSSFVDRRAVSAVNDDLTFELTGLYRLPLVVGIYGLPEGWVLKSVRYDGRDITNIATDFGAASRERRLNVLVTDRVAKPRIRVTDAAGQPVTAYQVVLLRPDLPRSSGTFGGLPEAPSRDGVAALGPTLPGDYLVAAVTWDDFNVLLHHPDRVDDVRSLAQRVTFAEGDERTLELHLTRVPPARQ